MLVGEQPGDEEDKKGLPFVGPAGRLLDRALEAAGVEREHLYVTNAVKHSSGSCAASAGSTRPRRSARSMHATSGWKKKLKTFSPR